MGCYVNPKDMSKEEWLNGFGERVNDVDYDEAVKMGCLPVVLLDNGIFTAAGVAYSKQEADEFTAPDDRRPKTFYHVRRELLYDVSDLKHWEKR